MAKREVKETFGRIVLFRGLTDKRGNLEDVTSGSRDICEILDVEDDQGEYIRSGHYILPKADATILGSDEGMIYAYNVSLPYLDEIAHLAKVEENIVIGQAFLYPGRSNPNVSGGPNLFQWALVIFVFLMGAFAIFAK